LVFARQILEEHSSIQHQVASRAKRAQTHKQSQYNPIRRRSRNDSEYGADEQREVERVLPADDVCTNTPKQGAYKHTNVGGDGQTARVGRVKLERGLAGDNGLDEED